MLCGLLIMRSLLFGFFCLSPPLVEVPDDARDPLLRRIFESLWLWAVLEGIEHCATLCDGVDVRTRPGVSVVCKAAEAAVLDASLLEGTVALMVNTAAGNTVYWEIFCLIIGSIEDDYVGRRPRRWSRGGRQRIMWRIIILWHWWKGRSIIIISLVIVVHIAIRRICYCIETLDILLAVTVRWR